MKKHALPLLIVSMVCLLFGAGVVYAEMQESYPTTVTKIEFDDIRPLVMERNYSIIERSETLDDAAVYYDVSDSTLGAALANIMTVYGYEANYITYNINLQQVNMLAQKQICYEKAYAAALKQYDLKMITASALTQAETNMTSTAADLRNLQQSQKTILQNFNLAIQQEYDNPMELGTIPALKDSMIEKIDVDQDYNEAKDLSYTVRGASDTDDQINAEKNFKSGFYQCYQTLLDKLKALKIEQTKMAAAEETWKTAQLKADLGMISSMELQNAKLNYEAQKLSLVSAEGTLFLAYDSYYWAKQGAIVSSAS